MYQSAEGITDYSPGLMQVETPVEKISSLQEEKPHIDANKTCHSELVTRFIRSLKDVHPNVLDSDAAETWEFLKNVIYDKALSSLGKQQCKTQDSFETQSHELLPVIEEKQNVFTAYKRLPNEGTLKVVRSKM